MQDTVGHRCELSLTVVLVIGTLIGDRAELRLEVLPRRGDGWLALARRYCGGSEPAGSSQTVTVGVRGLSPEDLATLVERYGGYTIALLDRSDSAFWRAQAADNADSSVKFSQFGVGRVVF